MRAAHAREDNSGSAYFKPLVPRLHKVHEMESGEGYSCLFVEAPPDIIQTECPLCLLVLRQPRQVTCCGKSFCRVCLDKFKSTAARQSDVVFCPCCNNTKIVDYPNIGLQQSLHGLRVHCVNKDKGCEWRGELGELDNHLNIPHQVDSHNLNQGLGTGTGTFESCKYVLVRCIKCHKMVQRCKLEDHSVVHQHGLQSEPAQSDNSANEMSTASREGWLMRLGVRMKFPYNITQKQLMFCLVILLAFFVAFSISLYRKDRRQGTVAMPLTTWRNNYESDLFYHQSISSYNIAATGIAISVMVVCFSCCVFCCCCCALCCCLLL